MEAGTEFCQVLKAKFPGVAAASPPGAGPAAAPPLPRGLLPRRQDVSGKVPPGARQDTIMFIFLVQRNKYVIYPARKGTIL